MENLTMAVTETGFNNFITSAKKDFKLNKSGSKDKGPLSMKWQVKAHLEGGKIDLVSQNSEIKIKELDVVWDRLFLELGFDIPEVCVGGFCIIPKPFGGCILRAPKICVFKKDPDVKVPLNLSGTIESEISASMNVLVNYVEHPTKGTKSDHKAHFDNTANAWQVLPLPRWVELDLIDVADTVGNIMDRLIDKVLDVLFFGMKGWVRDAVEFILGGITKLIRKMLDLVDDVTEWVFDLIADLGLVSLIQRLVAKILEDKNIMKIEEPFPLPESNSRSKLLPILLPIPSLKAFVDRDEFVVQAQIG